ncbi:MAG TPA: YdcF family protein [Gemmatimonadaceae bacterium]|nr:YdcF family protein [Gemmatimonadaceae bacterium]
MKLGEPTPRKSASLGVRLTQTALLIAIALWVLSLMLVILFERIDTSKHADAIVVMGAAQYDGKPSPVLRARVDHAIQLWRRGLAPVLITTGGRGVGDTTTEAAVERRYAIAHGVPDSAILIEPESRSTRESLRNVATMLKHDARDVILVSDPFHMLRLSILAHRFGLRPRTSPTPTSPITANRSAYWHYTLQESVKAPIAFFFEFTDR